LDAESSRRANIGSTAHQESATMPTQLPQRPRATRRDLAVSIALNLVMVTSALALTFAVLLVEQRYAFMP
jgi:hypothetical protein